uniref:Core-2/I-Branching enzyme n=1 Tax=Panagrolaimus sp. PS1159 TaxID=55785 RepID=A0AC35FLN3_9BILA
MECEDIFSRHYFPLKPLTNSEKDFPIAFARIVYRDYYFLETELATNYQPQNFYCYAIDKKSKKIFHEQIKNLSKCFPNVFFTKKEYAVDSAGHFMNIAHLECIKLLNEFKWKYVVLLQNHDFAIKTNAEMVQIFKWLNGTNDVELRKLPKKRIDKTYNYTFEDLKLFKNETRNSISFNGFPPQLNFAKGYVESSLSKEMVNFMLNEMDLTELLIRLNKRGFGVDEIFIPTLQATEALNIPGGFFHRCIDKMGGNIHFTRKSSWNGANCQSKILRHGICVYGLEDLIVLENYPQIFANKMIQDVDFGAYICWSERMFNRTFNENRLDPIETLNATIYLEHPAVRYNRERHLPNFDPEKFQC